MTDPVAFMVIFGWFMVFVLIIKWIGRNDHRPPLGHGIRPKTPKPIPTMLRPPGR